MATNVSLPLKNTFFTKISKAANDSSTKRFYSIRIKRTVAQSFQGDMLKALNMFKGASVIKHNILE